ncbi:MAG: cell division protein FtsZ [Oscillospiraceae bacterium]|jgi:cell division protein FtsZ|nr:cell division protein FtsZ [Oscillospiraceae bacterium]
MFTLDDTPTAGSAKIQPQKKETVAPEAEKRESEKTLPISLDINNDGIRIKVIGVGGAGGNAVSKMAIDRVRGVTYINVNTDKAALNASGADIRIQIGEKTTNGKGAGSVPDVGRKSAEESRKKIIEMFDDTDLVFITAGMGGGTGTGAAPVVAEIARECGVLTVAVVTKPFKFEGSRKSKVAQEGIEELLDKVDTLIVIPNEKLREVSPQKITLTNAFGIADGVLRQAVSGIADLLSSTGFINLDFADLKAILKDAGYAHMGVGEASGKTKVEDSAIAAVESPLMETSIRGAQRILIRVTGSPDITMEEIELVVGSVQGSAHPEANIIFGVDFDENLSDSLRVVLIATDFDKSKVWDAAVPIIASEQPEFQERARKNPEPVTDGGNRVVKSEPVNFTEPLPEPQPQPQPPRIRNNSGYNRNLAVDIPFDDDYDVIRPSERPSSDSDGAESEDKTDWGDFFSLFK